MEKNVQRIEMLRATIAARKEVKNFFEKQWTDCSAQIEAISVEIDRLQAELDTLSNKE